ncbi:MAG: methyltransferase family protein [Promethearchaeota archaeon]
MKGMDKLREKLPAYPGKRLAILPLRALLTGILGYAFLIILSVTPRFFPSNDLLRAIEPVLPLVGSVLLAAFALWLIWGLWNKRIEMKEQYGDLAYQKMINRGLSGVFLIPSIVFLAFTLSRSFPTDSPVNPITTQLSTSLLYLLGNPLGIELWVRMILSFILLILGMLTVRSALLTFGLDYMAVVYLFYPDESEIQQHEIYSVIRHPAYLSGILLSAAGLFFRFSVYSILLFLLVYMVFRLQIWKEEKELIERFGEGYNEYRRTTPAFFIRPSKIKAFFRFLRPD